MIEVFNLRRLVSLFAVAAGLIGIVRCGSGDRGPTGSSDLGNLHSGTALADVTARNQESLASLQGRLTDIVTGEPIAAARVQVEGVGGGVTGPDGSFQLPIVNAGEFPLSVEADGYWRRESRLLAGTFTPLEIDLIPVEGPFDLHFFDHVFRNVGESGTRRWSWEPRFEIWTKVFDCVVVERGFCREMVATEENATQQFINISHDVIATDSSKLTGGAVLGTDLAEHAHPPGTVLSGAEDLMPAHTITVALVQLPSDTGSWAWYWTYEDGGMFAGHIQISKRHHKLERGVVSHELAHVLGYGHPQGGDYVPLPSIMRYGHGSEPTKHDVLHGRVLYRRPPGSRTPDVDPEGYVMNRQRSLEARPAKRIETPVRN